jgi:glycosyltransferase involved in cell wall biosynthesis
MQRSADRWAVPLVSAVIPCHTQAAYMAEAVESVLAQTYPRVEVVVVDDGAPDDRVLAVALEYGAQLVRLGRNCGCSVARNAGIAASSGEYVLALDADDLVDRTYVAKAVSALARSPDAGVCYAQVQTFGNASWSWAPPSGWSLRQLLAKNRLPVEGVFRRACWEAAGGYPPGVDLCEDWDLWIRVALHGWRFLRIPEYLVYYRRHDANASARLADVEADFARAALSRYGAQAGGEPIARDVLPAEVVGEVCAQQVAHDGGVLRGPP